MSQPTLSRDQVLQNRYRILDLLGHGGMGAVYCAWDTRLNISMAIKEMVPQPDLDTHVLVQLRQQFQQEAQILARLSHPHLARVTDFFEELGNAYLVMDLVEGENLGKLIEQQAPLPESQVVAWADQLLDALAYCHAQRIIHRDIKPWNVIIRPNGQAVLVDFGLVKLWNPDDSRTQTAIRGFATWSYAPLEQYDAASGHTDTRSDIYNLGATLYHALTGRVPARAVTRATNPATLVPIQALNPRVSLRTAEAVTRAMALQPTDRFQSAQEMLAALPRQPAEPLPSTADIRQILLRSFTAEEFTALCFDYFRDVYDTFTASTTQEQRVQLLIEHCVRRELIPKLLAAIQRAQAERHEGFSPQVRLGPPESRRDPGQIFIDYARQDSKFAHRLADDLEKHGWRVWTTPSSSRPGEKWTEATDRGLAESGVFVLVVTQAAAKSQRLQDEMKTAVELQHQGVLRFVPLAVEQCDVSSLESIYPRILFHDSYEDALEALLAELEQPGGARKAGAERQVTEKVEQQTDHAAEMVRDDVAVRPQVYDSEPKSALTSPSALAPLSRTVQKHRDPLWQRIGIIVGVVACIVALLTAPAVQRLVGIAPTPTNLPTPFSTFTATLPTGTAALPTGTATSTPSHTPTVTVSPTVTSTPTTAPTATARVVQRPSSTPTPIPLTLTPTKEEKEPKEPSGKKPPPP